MDRIGRSDLVLLLAPRTGPCVSLFMPLHPVGRDRMEDAIRVRKLADEAEDALVARGLRRPKARDLVAPLRALPDDDDAWQHRGHWLALFLAPDFVRTFHGDEAMEELLDVNDHFHIRPLLPLLALDDHFFVLALSQNRVRLLEGDAAGLHELPVADLPRNLADTLNIDGADRGEQVHLGARGNLGKQGGIYHGQGGKPDAAKEDLKSFLRRVAAVVDRQLNGARAPLVLATVASNMPVWREVSRYAYTDDGFIAGNPDHLTPHGLHVQAWPLVEPALARRREWLRRRLVAAEGSPKASIGLRQIVPAAATGRVDTLFLDCSRPRWGRYDAESGTVLLHAQREPGDLDLVELAAVETLRHRGQVVAMRQENTAAGEAAEALLRY